MRKSKNRVRLQVEVMETRALLSALAPSSSVAIRNTVVADFERNLETQPPINSVRLRNDTSHRVVIKATFTREMNPTPITLPPRVIPIKGSDDFIFHKDLVGFISIEVKREGSLGPFKGPFYLSKPAPGYRGAIFKITASNDTYTVSGPFPS